MTIYKAKQHFISIFSLIILLCISLCIPFSAHAQSNDQNISKDKSVEQNIRVSPAILPIQLSPGKTNIYEVRIDNLTDIPLPVHIQPDRIIPSSDDVAVPEDEKNASPLSSWMVVDKEDTIIPARGTHTVSLTIKVPTVVEVGGYYATLTIAPMIQAQTSIPRVIPRITVIVLASLGVPDNNAMGDTIGSILSFTSQTISSEGPIDASFEVKNTALFHFSAKPFITITPLLGSRKAYRMEIPEKIILPGKIRSWQIKILENAKPNIYRLSLAVSVGNGRWTKPYEQTVLIAPLSTFGAWAGIILMLMLVLAVRKNIKRAVKTFFSSK